MFAIIVNQILKMLLLLLLGYLCYRIGIIDQAGNRMLANLLLMVVNPILAVMSLQTEYSPRLVRGLLLTYLLAFLVHIGAILFTTVLIRSKDNPDCGIERFCSMYSNCGFIGIPLVQSVLGGEGVLYITAYMTVFNLFSWTHGLAIITGKASGKDLKKGLLSPMVIASCIGLILFFTQIRLPSVLADSLNYVAGMNTPLAMIIAGTSVAQSDLLGMLKQKRLYLVCAFKLLAIPALVLAALACFRIESTVAYTILIAAACPVAATGTAFTLRYQKNYRYCSELYAFSTVLSLVTIPLFIFAADHLII